MAVGLIAAFKYGAKFDLLSPARDPFLGSLEEVAVKKFSYDPSQKAESFYNSLRFSGNIFRVRQMVVNLKRSPENDRPMALFQVIVEGNSQDVIVEMKDREGEMSDTIQRATEEFTFGELQLPEGKKALLLKIKEAVNTRLTTGQVRRAYFQSIVLKP